MYIAQVFNTLKDTEVNEVLQDIEKTGLYSDKLGTTKSFIVLSWIPGMTLERFSPDHYLCRKSKKLHDFVFKSFNNSYNEISREDLSDEETVLSHNDYTPRNIVVDNSGKVKSIIDWEYCDYYPRNYEYYKILSS